MTPFRAVFACGAVLAASCAKGTEAPSGANEPIVVHGGQFREGALPSTGSVTMDAGVLDFRVTNIVSVDNVVRQGEADKSLTGDASLQAVTIGVRFPDLGSGYWVFPVDVPDPLTPNAVTWTMTADFGANIPPGIHYLDFVPFDANAGYGATTELKICVPDPIAGLHACSDRIPLPEAAIAITWDTDSDVDLHATTPDGIDVSPKNPSTAKPEPDGGVMPNPKVDATFDRDSNAGCVIDRQRREDLIFPTYPERGRWQIRADLFDSCGKPATTFTVSVYVAEGDPPNRSLVLKFQRSGELLQADEDAGGPGLFVTDFDF